MRLPAYIASRPRIKDAGDKRARISAERNLARFLQLIGRPLDLEEDAWNRLGAILGRYGARDWMDAPQSGETLVRSIQHDLASERARIEAPAGATSSRKTPTPAKAADTPEAAPIAPTAAEPAVSPVPATPTDSEK